MTLDAAPQRLASTPEINAPRFNIVTKAMESAGETADGHKRFRATASSSITDRAGDEISLKALERMANRFREGLTIFMDHDYLHVDSAFGTTDRAEIIQRGVDPKTSTPIWDLDIEGIVNEPSERAVRLWKSIDGGYVKFGCSVNAFVLDHVQKHAGGLKIDDMDVFEASIVGVPMNQRSWVQKAVRAIKSFNAAVEDGEDNVTETISVTAGGTTVVVKEADLQKAVAETAVAEGFADAAPAEVDLDSDEAIEKIASAKDGRVPTDGLVQPSVAGCPTCGKSADDGAGCTNSDFHAPAPEKPVKDVEAEEKAANREVLTTGGQEADTAATPETAPAEPDGDKTDPEGEDPTKVAAVSTDDLHALVKHVERLVSANAELARERDEANRLRQTAEDGLRDLQGEVTTAKGVIEKVMREPLRPKAVGVIADFAERYPQFDPRIAKYLNAREENK